MLRFTSPVTHMARQATDDVEMRGQLIKKGDTVVMLYGSANRDEDIFGATAEDFDIARSPNPHIAFGCGEHACLGAQLARLEARVMFEVLLGAYPSIELVGDVTRLARHNDSRRQADARAIGSGLTDGFRLHARTGATSQGLPGRLEAVMTPERRAAVAVPMEGGGGGRRVPTRPRRDAGLLGVAWPTEYGGGGLTALEQYIFGEGGPAGGRSAADDHAEHRRPHADPIRYRGTEGQVSSRDP